GAPVSLRHGLLIGIPGHMYPINPFTELKNLLERAADPVVDGLRALASPRDEQCLRVLTARSRGTTRRPLDDLRADRVACHLAPHQRCEARRRKWARHEVRQRREQRVHPPGHTVLLEQNDGY